jgi:nucleotide-binding universal stress UspA family protein
MAARYIEGHGSPADVIVDEAEDNGADLIVVGTRGLHAGRRLLLGSVSTKVVHHAPCDVLVVR